MVVVLRRKRAADTRAANPPALHRRDVPVGRLRRPRPSPCARLTPLVIPAEAGIQKDTPSPCEWTGVFAERHRDSCLTREGFGRMLTGRGSCETIRRIATQSPRNSICAQKSCRSGILMPSDCPKCNPRRITANGDSNGGRQDSSQSTSL